MMDRQTDPWADVRNRMRLTRDFKARDKNGWAQDIQDLGQLLADADALLAAVRAGNAYKDTLAEFGREPEGIYHVGDELLLDDWTEALAALSENLKCAAG